MDLRAWLDSPTALVAGTTLHTLGAIGVVVALAMILAEIERVRAGRSAGGLGTAATSVVWFSVAANLLGGGMRTYVPSHPTLLHLGDSAWVQVMLLKHLFILAALAGLVHLHHIVVPWLVKRNRHGVLPERAPSAQAVSVWLVLVGVVGASVLGAFAQITPTDHEESAGDSTNAVGFNETMYLRAQGALTSLGPLAETAEGTFQVPVGVASLRSELGWSDSVASLMLTLRGPGGEAHQSDASSAIALDRPAPGTWSYTVEATNALNVEWALLTALQPYDAGLVLLQESVTIQPGVFFEINTVMEEGQDLCWDWSASGQTVLHFDVHTHFDDEVQYLVDESAHEGTGCIVSEREGFHSLLWELEGAAPVTVRYAVWGQFEVDSYFPPR